MNGVQDFTHLRGFNYAPSYGSSGLDLWQRFDPAVVSLELSRDAFTRDPGVVVGNFEIALRIADSNGLRVMPVLFNR